VVFFVLAALFATLYAGPTALRAARTGRATLTEARNAFLRRDVDAARREFSSAASLFRSSKTRLASPMVWPSRLIPVLGTHVRTALTLSRVAERVSEAGLAATAAQAQLPGRELKLVDGRVDLAAVRRATTAFGASIAAAADIEEELSRIPTGWVIDSLARARAEALQLLPSAIEGLRKGQTAIEAMPSLLGENGRKRYVVAFSNLAELRGSGGFIGYITSLAAERGDLDLEDVSGRPTELFPPPGETQLAFPEWFPADLRRQSRIFQNINVTTDFPTVGRFIVQSAGPALGPVQGVIGVDPIGLAAILRLTGPITVAAWPQPITADSVSRVAQHDVYLRYPTDDDQRQDFFSQLVRTTFDRLVTGVLAFRPESFGDFDTAVRGGHFRMFSSDAEDQAAFKELGLAGGVERTQGATDVLSFVSQNGAGNKADWFLHRNVRYHVRLEPGDRAAVSEIDVEMRNDAPSSGLPEYVIGASGGVTLPLGTNRQNVTVLRSPQDELRAIAIQGRPVSAVQAAEGPLRSYRVTTEIPARSSKSIRLISEIPLAFTTEGRERIYRLHLLPQPVANRDVYEVSIEVPAGWRSTGTRTFSGELTGDRVLEVRVYQTKPAWIVDKVFLEPWREVRRIFGRIF
jgi:hypothetical protein